MSTREQEQTTGDLRQLDARALTRVYDSFSQVVYKYARYRLGDERLAEDITSDVFMKLLEALRRGAGPDTNVRAWLLGTAAHLVTDHLRLSYRRPTEALRDEHPDASPSPGDELDRRQRSREFQVAYAGLTAEQQHILALRFGEGFSLEETAGVVRKNVNAVKALQFRALQSLKRRMIEVGNDED
jgi:RNA polymerase sigma-70 factor (ECF subfamily)